MPRNWGATKNFEKKWKMDRKLTIWIRQKSELNSSVSEKISAETALFKSYSQLWKFSFSALFRTESSLFSHFQVMNSTEWELKCFWITADQRWLSLRLKPGGLLNELAFRVFEFRSESHYVPEVSSNWPVEQSFNESSASWYVTWFRYLLWLSRNCCKLTSTCAFQICRKLWNECLKLHLLK